MKPIEGELFCTFRTTLGSAFQVPSERHALPDSMDNSELTELLRLLLQNSGKQSHHSFDFLIGGELLLGSLKSHLVKVGQTGEKNVEIVYVLGFGKPQIDNSVDVTNGINRVFIHEGFVIRKSAFGRWNL